MWETRVRVVFVLLCISLKCGNSSSFARFCHYLHDVRLLIERCRSDMCNCRLRPLHCNDVC